MTCDTTFCGSRISGTLPRMGSNRPIRGTDFAEFLFLNVQDDLARSGVVQLHYREMSMYCLHQHFGAAAKQPVGGRELVYGAFYSYLKLQGATKK